jgi:hypothetical protein
MSQVTSRPAAAQHRRDLALLRRVRDRVDRAYAQPLDGEALARGAHTSAGRFSRELCRPASAGATRRGDGGDAVVRRETGDQTGQKSRSAVAEPHLE